MKKIALLMAVLICLTASCTACAEKKKGYTEVTTAGVPSMDIEALDTSEYVSLCEYKGLTIEYLPAQEEPSSLIWEKVYFESKIIKYPEQQVNYYLDQISARYIFVAKERDEPYEDVLAMLGVTEATMLKEAQYMVAQDLIVEALLRAEQIELTEEDKTKNLDKYMERYVKEYGYAEDYVKKNLMDELYDEMLYDKMIEKLVLLNTFVKVGELVDQ